MSAKNWTDENGITRNWQGSPLILPPGAEGKPLAYRRASTVAGALDSKDGLIAWFQRRLMQGLTVDPSILDEAKGYFAAETDKRHPEHRDAKKALDALAAKARELGESDKAADIGTMLHEYCVVADDMGDLSTVPEEYRADLSAYIEAMDGIKVLDSEQFVVVDQIKVAGTYDRLLMLPDGRVILADIKTGADVPRYPHSTCHQLSIYAHGMRYDPDDGHRTPIHPRLDQSVGMLIHLPQGEARCDLYMLDIEQGWDWMLVAADLHDNWSKAKPIERWSA